MYVHTHIFTVDIQCAKFPTHLQYIIPSLGGLDFVMLPPQGVSQMHSQSTCALHTHMRAKSP